MRTKVTLASPDAALTRILDALGQELIEASDEEIMAAAKDLGMDPTMRGSAAFAGLTYFSKPQLSDFFEFEACEKLRPKAERIARETQPNPAPKARGLKRAKNSTESKDALDE